MPAALLHYEKGQLYYLSEAGGIATGDFDLQTIESDGSAKNLLCSITKDRYFPRTEGDGYCGGMLIQDGFLFTNWRIRRTSCCTGKRFRMFSITSGRERTGLLSESETGFMMPRFSVLAADRNGLTVFVSFSEQGVRGKIIFLPIEEEEIRILAEEE